MAHVEFAEPRGGGSAPARRHRAPDNQCAGGLKKALVPVEQVL
jgi:hypothetical protein